MAARRDRGHGGSGTRWLSTRLRRGSTRCWSQALDHPPAERARWIAERLRHGRGAQDAPAPSRRAWPRAATRRCPPAAGCAATCGTSFAREVDVRSRDRDPVRRAPRPLRDPRAARASAAWAASTAGTTPRSAARWRSSRRSTRGTRMRPELRRRLEREARLLATLKPPEHRRRSSASEIIEGSPYLVLELVEGQTLRPSGSAAGRCASPKPSRSPDRWPPRWRRARKGVVHRDLKPGNVAPDPRRAREGASTSDRRLRARRRTPPESREPPRRAPGAVRRHRALHEPRSRSAAMPWTRGPTCGRSARLLHEMLSGGARVPRARHAEVMAAVLRDDGLEPTARRHAHERAAAARVAACGAESRERLQDDRRRAPRAAGDGRSGRPPVPLARVRGRARGAAWRSHRAFAARARVRVTRTRRCSRRAAGLRGWALELPAGSRLRGTTTPRPSTSPRRRAPGRASRCATACSASTSARWTAWSGGGGRRYRRRVAARVSTDGSSIAFFADRKLKRVPLTRAGLWWSWPRRAPIARGASFTPDGSVVYAPSQTSGLFRRGTGTAARLCRLTTARPRCAASTRIAGPQVLPGGAGPSSPSDLDSASFDEAHLDAVALDTGERRHLVPEAAQGRYAGGRSTSPRAGRMFAVAFDPQTLAQRGSPEMVPEGVRYDPRNGGRALRDLRERHAHLRACRAHVRRGVPGLGRRCGPADPHRRHRACLPRAAPQPRRARVAARIGTESSSDLWIVDTTTATLTRLSFGLSPRRPVWTPDGRAVTVAAQADGRWRLLNLPPRPAPRRRPWCTRASTASIRTRGRRTLARSCSRSSGPTPAGTCACWRWAPDGRATGAVRDLASTPFNETYATVSPDGRYFAYDCDELDQVSGSTSHRSPIRPRACEARTPTRAGRTGARDGELVLLVPAGRAPGRSKVPEGLHRDHQAPASSPDGRPRQ